MTATSAITLKQFREKHGVAAQAITAMRNKTSGFPDAIDTCFEIYMNGNGRPYRKRVPTFDEVALTDWYKIAKQDYVPSTRKPKMNSVSERFDNAMARLFISRADEIRPRKQAELGTTHRINTRVYGYDSF